MGFKVAFKSENVFAQSNVSRQKVPGGWSSNIKRAMGQFGVYARNDEHRSIGRAQSPRWCTGLYQLAEIRRSGCGPHLVSQYSQFIGDPLPHRKPV